MSKDRLALGRRGEERAVSYLKGLSYRILERNYKSRFGEIDIIAKDKGVLSFVEVKTRQTPSFGKPEEGVHPKKQHQLSKVALDYLHKNKLTNCEARFDVIAIQFLPQGEEIELIKNAFEARF